MKKIIIAASLIATMFSSAVFASANAREGDVNLTIRAQGLQKEGSSRISKKRGYGGELELAYFMNNNVAGVFAVGYNKFQGKNPIVGVKGVRATYVPFKLGFQYHMVNPNGFNPYLGLGYQYVNGNYKALNAGDTFKKRNLHGGYLQLGVNCYLSDEAAFNIDLQKAIMAKYAEHTNLGLTPTTTKIRYNPLILSVGLTFALNGN